MENSTLSHGKVELAITELAKLPTPQREAIIKGLKEMLRVRQVNSSDPEDKKITDWWIF